MSIINGTDGKFTLYTDTASDFVVTARMDSDINYGSGIVTDTGSSVWAVANIAFNAAANTVTVAAADGSTIALGTIQVPTLGSGASIGYVAGDAGDGAESVAICTTGTTLCNGGLRITQTNARGDGTFKLTLPVGTYPVTRASNTSASYDCTTDLVITDGATTNLTFDIAGMSCTTP